jgi:hypothetical protein
LSSVPAPAPKCASTLETEDNEAQKMSWQAINLNFKIVKNSSVVGDRGLYTVWSTRVNTVNVQAEIA